MSESEILKDFYLNHCGLCRIKFKELDENLKLGTVQNDRLPKWKSAKKSVFPVEFWQTAIDSWESYIIQKNFENFFYAPLNREEIGFRVLGVVLSPYRSKSPMISVSFESSCRSAEKSQIFEKMTFFQKFCPDLGEF